LITEKRGTEVAEKTVDAYIAALDPERAAIATRLRDIVRAAAPGARESIKWAQPVYESNGPFVAMKAFPRWVTLTFWRGAAIHESDDPDGLLAGEGDRMRHARFASLDQIGEAALADLVRAAVELNAALGDPTKRG
jgi:hypothetical protein